MNDFLALAITLLAIIACSLLIIKKFNPIVVFMAAGIIINLYLVLAMGFQPLSGKDSTGNGILDIFGLIGYEFKDQLSGVGLNLMIVAGYATLMTAMGASAKLADIATKPLVRLHAPYVILSLLFVVGVILKMMITSHSGLALLLMATVFPILCRLGVSKLSAASAIMISGFIDWGPNDGAVMFAAQNVAKMGVGDYFIHYQLLIACLTIAAVAIFMPFYYKRLDSKAGRGSNEEQNQKEEKKYEEKSNTLPAVYAILPPLPLLLVIGSLAVPGIKLDVFTANVIGILVTLVFEIIRVRKNLCSLVAGHLGTLFTSMGTAFANIVTLIVAADIFAKALIKLGGITTVADAIARLQGAQLITILALTLLSFFAVIILGSGNAGWYAFGPLVTDIAPKVGLKAYQISVPMQLAAGMGRALSPVAAAMIAVAGLCEVKVEDLIKRDIPPVIVGLIVNFLASYIIYVLL